MNVITIHNILGFVACLAILLLCVYVFVIFSFCRIRWAIFLWRNRKKMKSLWGINLNYFFLGNINMADCKKFIKPEYPDFVDTFNAYAVHIRKKLDKSDLIVSIGIIVAVMAFVGYKLASNGHGD